MSATRQVDVAWDAEVPVPSAAPPIDPHAALIGVTRHRLRRALAAVLYPAIPATDRVGQARIDRVTERLIELIDKEDR